MEQFLLLGLAQTTSASRPAAGPSTGKAKTIRTQILRVQPQYSLPSRRRWQPPAAAQHGVARADIQTSRAPQSWYLAKDRMRSFREIGKHSRSHLATSA